MVKSGAPVWYQTSEEGSSALHAAAYRQDLSVTKYLLEQGAVWNAVDNQGNTAGDIALSFNNTELYTVIRDAAIRSEMLLALLSSRSSLQSASSIVLSTTDTSAAASTEAFLASRLRYTEDDNGQPICMLKVEGGDEIGVMMGWERGIMEETVMKLTDGQQGPLRILNVGFGLGIIDSFFQALDPPPAEHVIVEPHPDVLRHMKSLGWHEKPGVRILEGKWQDFVESPELLGTGFDVVYTDTFSEDYQQLQAFFQHLPDLLSGPTARFGFFNGLGATNALIYDVYTHVSELHLADLGLDVQWSDVDVSDDDGRWGKTREYFALPLYRLPVASMTLIS
ncbi:hypothetical protein FISHEDRAFT_65775 [Fistulina hepatica ATCC 64428]|uniref:RMT2 domain-containing protein n=1 Tax=Fistulina hepatica ATCC 64428 TaxID=1128425 RepID=A0A0D7AB09_9AGAR|nr:hypothetical protein FISHEDRAFT_65775 [Fistulina hepatica ATCC 64428]